MIEVRGVTKRFGGKTAVDDLTFTVELGKVTGFPGPNGAGNAFTGLRRSWLPGARRWIGRRPAWPSAVQRSCDPRASRLMVPLARS